MNTTALKHILIIQCALALLAVGVAWAVAVDGRESQLVVAALYGGAVPPLLSLLSAWRTARASAAVAAASLSPSASPAAASTAASPPDSNAILTTPATLSGDTTSVVVDGGMMHLYLGLAERYGLVLLLLGAGFSVFNLTAAPMVLAFAVGQLLGPLGALYTVRDPA